MTDKKDKMTATKISQAAALIALGVSVGVSAAPQVTKSQVKNLQVENLEPKNMQDIKVRPQQPTPQLQENPQGKLENKIKIDGPPRP